jgi:hypothetical protein
VAPPQVVKDRGHHLARNAGLGAQVNQPRQPGAAVPRLCIVRGGGRLGIRAIVCNVG